MQEEKVVTKEEYVIAKLSNKIGALEKQLAEAEFAVLLLKQEVQKLEENREKLLDDSSGTNDGCNIAD